MKRRLILQTEVILLTLGMGAGFVPVIVDLLRRLAALF